MKIEEGKYYRNGYGRTIGPMTYETLTGRFWSGSLAYAPDGRCLITAISRLQDLIQEVGKPDPGDATTPIVDATYDVKEAIAAKAVAIVNGSRQQEYGTPENNFERIARFWQAYFLNTGRDIKVTAADVSPLMRLMKEARLCATPDHLDSHVDLVGYTLTGAQIAGVKA